MSSISEIVEKIKSEVIELYNISDMDHYREYLRHIYGKLAENETYKKMLGEFEKKIADTVYNYVSEEYDVKVYIIHETPEIEDHVVNNLAFVVKIVRHMYEITEMCSGEEIETDEEYEECLEEAFKEVNREYAFHTRISAKLEHYTITVDPEYCDTNYCDVGTYMEIVAEDIDFTKIDQIFNDIVEIVEAIAKLITK